MAKGAVKTEAKKEEKKEPKYWKDSSELNGKNPKTRMDYLKDTLKHSQKGGLFGKKNSANYDNVINCMEKLDKHLDVVVFMDPNAEQRMDELFKAYEELIDACNAYSSGNRRTAKGKNRQLIVNYIRQYAIQDLEDARYFFNGVLDESIHLRRTLTARPISYLLHLFRIGDFEKKQPDEEVQAEKPANKGKKSK